MGQKHKVGTDAQNGTETLSGTDAHLGHMHIWDICTFGTDAHLLMKKKFLLIKLFYSWVI